MTIIYRFKQDWEPAAEVPGGQTTGKIPNLEEKQELQFRVVAYNKAGPSPASEPTKIHIIKHKNCKLLNHYNVIIIFLLIIAVFKYSVSNS